MCTKISLTSPKGQKGAINTFCIVRRISAQSAVTCCDVEIRRMIQQLTPSVAGQCLSNSCLSIVETISIQRACGLKAPPSPFQVLWQESWNAFSQNRFAKHLNSELFAPSTGKHIDFSNFCRPKNDMANFQEKQRQSSTLSHRYNNCGGRNQGKHGLSKNQWNWKGEQSSENGGTQSKDPCKLHASHSNKFEYTIPIVPCPWRILQSYFDYSN